MKFIKNIHKTYGANEQSKVSDSVSYAMQEAVKQTSTLKKLLRAVCPKDKTQFFVEKRMDSML